MRSCNARVLLVGLVILYRIMENEIQRSLALIVCSSTVLNVLSVVRLCDDIVVVIGKGTWTEG